MFLLYFDKINSALVSKRDFNVKKILLTSYFWMVD